MPDILQITALTKRYESGVIALDAIDLSIRAGEIFALLGPNGAGKTSLIAAVCGLARVTDGRIVVDGLDIRDDYRRARRLIGLVPQELTTDAFTNPREACVFSRGLFGLPPDPARIDRLLADLSLTDKADSQIRFLSGGMKRRVMIAKALSHEPRLLFLDEPTAGVDVALRRDLWALVERLRADGVTIVLTTHYIEEAEAIADRIGIIDGGRLRLVEDKDALMKRMGHRQVVFRLSRPLDALPAGLDQAGMTLSPDGRDLVRAVKEGDADDEGMTAAIAALAQAGVAVADIESRRSSLEQIFTQLVGGTGQASGRAA